MVAKGFGRKQQKWGLGRWVPKGKVHGLRVGIHMIKLGMKGIVI
jgi:hypothetical protein